MRRLAACSEGFPHLPQGVESAPWGSSVGAGGPMTR
jgi:hypothetical protein